MGYLFLEGNFYFIGVEDLVGVCYQIIADRTNVSSPKGWAVCDAVFSVGRVTTDEVEAL